MSGQVYAVLARPQGEHVAAEDLREHGIAAYVPTLKRWHYGRGPRRERVVALLSRYLFVYTDDIERDFEIIRRARRVTGIIGHHGGPQPLNADWLACVLVSECFGLFDFTAKKKPKFSIGQTLRIIGGKFKGYIGKLTRIDTAGATVYVEGKFLHGDVPVTLNEIEAVTEQKAA